MKLFVLFPLSFLRYRFLFTISFLILLGSLLFTDNNRKRPTLVKMCTLTNYALSRLEY